MVIQHYTSATRTPINWASGTSTEIFIYPASSSFAERNFIFRISTATVEAEESTFTFFKGITRHLMILKGELELIHEGRYTRHLKPYEQDTFSGEWNTRSKGKVTDFNLMLNDSSEGSLTHNKLDSENSRSFESKSPYFFLYLATGLGTLSNGDQVKDGDLIHILRESEVTIQALEPCDVIEIEVRLSEKHAS